MLKAVCAIYPPARIKKLDNTDPLDNAFLALMGEEAEQSDYDAASPINYINKALRSNHVNSWSLRQCS